MTVKRREFLIGAGGVAVVCAAASQVAHAKQDLRSSACENDPPLSGRGQEREAGADNPHAFNETYEGEQLNRIAFPMGGLGAGMICLEGNGALSHVSLHHEPDLQNEPAMFAALAIKGEPGRARILEGPLPGCKLSPDFSLDSMTKISGARGLPRFRSASFKARFPFAHVALSDSDMPVRVRLTGWSPFEPGAEDDASLPVAGLEYEITNCSSTAFDAIFSFNVGNLMVSPFESPTQAGAQIRKMPGGFVLAGSLASNKPWTAGCLAVGTDDPAVKINHAWFRGRGLLGADTIRIVWQDIANGACYERPPLADGQSGAGASLFVPLSLGAGESKTIAVRLAWYVGRSNLNLPGGKMQMSWFFTHDTRTPAPDEQCYKPWYAGRFASIEPLMEHWRGAYSDLRKRSERFSRTLFDSTLPPEAIEAVAANLTILKSPTVLRQTDGRLWGWEGCAESVGSCEGSCSHVWNYAHAVAHLFPRLERTLRETEFGPDQNEDGHQDFRSAIPIRPTAHDFPAAADGQLGGIMKVYRDWRISGDTPWLARLWPRVRSSLDYCIRTWDPRHTGSLEEPHHNTYDIEFWGPNGMCSSLYLGALKAATLLGAALADNTENYETLLQKGVRRMQSELFNGQFFIQKVQWLGLRAQFPADSRKGISSEPYTQEEAALVAREGPEHQYAGGCLSNGVVGEWLGWACGVPGTVDEAKVASHLAAVHRHNFKTDLNSVPNPATATRVVYGAGHEGGLVLCSWPSGGMPTLPFFYANEVWTGIEYQVASQMISLGMIEEGLTIVRTCRQRYDGRVRNPFGEIEAGHWYARAMSSYTLLQALSGARYDAVDRILYLKPAISGDFRCFLSTQGGYGTVGVKNGEPFVEVVSGGIPYRELAYSPAGQDRRDSRGIVS